MIIKEPENNGNMLWVILLLIAIGILLLAGLKV